VLDEDDDAHHHEQGGNLRCAQDIESDRHDDSRRQRRQRGITEQESHHQPDDGEDQRHLPGQADQHAEIGGDALAALEPEPDREEMTEKGAEAGPDRQVRRKMACYQHGGRALQRIEQQCRGGKALVAGAQNIGGADVAGADLAHIAKSGSAGEQKPERNRAQEIAEHERWDEAVSHCFPRISP
jgi:hypothetical protein